MPEIEYAISWLLIIHTDGSVNEDKIYLNNSMDLNKMIVHIPNK